MKNILFAGFTLTAAALSCASPVFAQTDHRNLEAELPITIEDAYPTAYLNREVQFVGRYERTGDDKDRYTLLPRFEYGFARNWQATIAAPFYLGNADKTGSGDIEVEALYNFNTESLSSPAYAVSGAVFVPSGKNSHGLDAQIKFLATRTINDQTMGRLHVNAAYRFNADPEPMERDGQFIAAIGYSRRLGPNAILLGDYVFEQEREKGKESQLIEAGLRYQATPLTIYSVGAGVGLTGESPGVRVTVGLQHALTF